MKNTLAQKKWNSCIYNKTKKLDLKVLDNKFINKASNFVDRVKTKKGRNDIVTSVEIAVVGNHIVAMRCNVQICNNQGEAINGISVFSLCAEEKFGNYYFNKVYKHSYGIDGTYPLNK